MKTKLLLFVAATLLYSFSYAKIWRVNNNQGITADFTTAQAAHDDINVSAGDTLYFEHSVASYGNLTMSKKLILIGTGAFLSNNQTLQYNLNAAFLTTIILRSSAANSVISVNSKDLSDTASGVTITRCRIENTLTIYNGDNCTISNCFLSTITLGFGANEGTYNITINNNIVVSSIGGPLFKFGTNGFCYTPMSVVCFNNSVASTMQIAGSVYNNVCQRIYTDGATPVTNNIFYDRPGYSTRNSSSTVNSCGNITDTLTSGNNNQFLIPIQNVFNNPALGEQNYDIGWKLKTASPAFGAGTGGVDCGATGGNAAYVFGIQPAIPTIYKLNVAPAQSGNSIGVLISTRSNN